MDKKNKKQTNNKENVKKNISKTKDDEHIQYDYDFIPTLTNWVNIDDQKETAKRLEDIDK